MGTWYKRQKAKYVLNHDIDGMDTILRGIIASNNPEPIKRQLISKIADRGSQPQPTSVIRSVLEQSATWFLNGDTEFIVSAGLEVFQQWGQSNQSTLESFFSREYLLSLLNDDYRNLANGPILIQESLRHLRNSSSYSNYLKVIEAKAISYIQDHVDVVCLRNFAIFLQEFKECIPKGDFTNTFCVTLLSSLSQLSVPEVPRDNAVASQTSLVKFVHDVNLVASFLRQLWLNSDVSAMQDSLRAIFAIIATPGEHEPSRSLGAIITYVPIDVVDTVVRTVTNNPDVPDTSMTLALERMIDWLAWPTASNVDQWIVAFLRELAAVKKFSIIIAVTESKAIQVLEKLQFSPLRKASFHILSHMLLSFQHSPELFHKILHQIPNIWKLLLSEEGDVTPASESYLNRLAELLYCLMYLHAGFPDLYDPILSLIKDFPRPSVEEMKEKIAQKKWSSQTACTAGSSSVMAEKSETGKVGLFNLGNTCYMNSVLQALFMCDGFRQGLLCQQPSPSESLIVKLQHVMAFLSLSQRPAYAPLNFLASSRPPWFVPGHQQDCSEFLKHLLDQLHEQQKSKASIEGEAPEADKSKADSVSRRGGPVLRPRAQNSAQPQKDAQLKKPASQVSNHGDQASGEVSQEQSTLIQQIYGGKVCTTIKCLNCNQESSQVESFTDIPLAFPNSEASPSPASGGSSDSSLDIEPKPESMEVKSDSQPATPFHLDDLIQYYLKPEKLTGDNKYHCDRCQGLHEGYRTIKIIKSPEYLILTLLRFAYDTKLHNRTKIFQEVKYPKSLVLPVDRGTNNHSGQQTAQTNSSSQNAQQANGQSQLGNSAQALLQRLTEGDSTGTSVPGDVYGLSAVIVHSGTSSECGHYYCYARHSFEGEVTCPQGNGEVANLDEVDFLQDKWYLFNDGHVSYANYSSFSSITQRFTTDTAYVLFYRKLQPNSQSRSAINLNESIVPMVVDPPLRADLREAVNKDNKQYLQEQENAARNKARRQQSNQDDNLSSYTWHDPNSDPDTDRGPPGSCGGGGGIGDLDTSGARFVF